MSFARSRVVWILLAGALAFASGVERVSAVPIPQAALPPVETPTSQWAPPKAGVDGFTWLRLVSGEWVKGEIKDLHDEKMTFKSEELDEFEYDWADVTAVISSRPHTLTTSERKVYTGFIQARGETIRILDGDGKELLAIKPDDVSGLIQGAQRERDYWGGMLSTGSTVQSGNSDQSDVNVLFKLNRRAAITRFDNTLTFNFSAAAGQTNKENTRLLSKVDVFISPELFVTPIGYEFFRDVAQNVGYRHTTGSSVGTSWSTWTADWDFSAGAAWQSTEFVSAPEGSESAVENWVARFSGKLEWDATSDIEVDLDYAINVPYSDAGAYTSNFLGVLSLDLFWELEFDFSVTWDRQNDPRPLSDGVVPQKDDFQLTTAIAWEF